MDEGCVEKRALGVVLVDDEADFGTAEDDPFRPCGLHLFDKIASKLFGFRQDNAPAQLVKNDPVQPGAIRRVGNNHFKAACRQARGVEILFHRIGGAEERGLAYPPGRHGVGCRVGDMEQGNFNRRLHVTRDLMHGVGANKEKIRTSRLDALACGREGRGNGVPVARSHIGFQTVKIDAHQRAFRRVQAAQAFLDQTVDHLVIGHGAFPAHAAKHSNGFH